LIFALKPIISHWSFCLYLVMMRKQFAGVVWVQCSLDFTRKKSPDKVSSNGFGFAAHITPLLLSRTTLHTAHAWFWCATRPLKTSGCNILLIVFGKNAFHTFLALQPDPQPEYYLLSTPTTPSSQFARHFKIPLKASLTLSCGVRPKGACGKVTKK